MRTENLVNRILFVFTFTLLLTATATAQQIRGVVQDQAGISLPGIHITLEKTKITAVSGTDGTFMIQVREVPESSAFWNESDQTGRTSGERVIGEDANRSETTEDQKKRRVGESTAQSIQESGGEKRGEISEEIILLASGIGYKSARVPVSYPPREEPVIIVLEAEIYQSPTVVVTATRTSRDLEEVSIPVQVVTGSEIDQSGSVRLSDVLAEQSALQLISDHGTGVQIQRFHPAYTLVMIDGNPLIGRTAGTLDLERVSVRNVEQIEIVKGPSSALWGSDALAGVINIITEKSSKPVSGGVTTRYGKNNSLDLAGDFSFRTDRWANDFFLNRNSTDGYRLNPGSVGQTVPEYENYTLGYQTQVELTDRAEAALSLRYFTENQQNLDFYMDEMNSQVLLDYAATREDLVLNPRISLQSADRLDITAGVQSSLFRSETEYTIQQTGDLYDSNDYRQFYNKPEVQGSYWWNDRHHSLIGSGAIFERLKADRYPDNPNFHTKFIYAQHSWLPGEQFEITGGFRYDVHSEYRSQLSPKLSARFNFSEKLQLRGSVGTGFKAPDIRQLFLDFTNATAGYSVLGASRAAEGIEKLIQDEQISQILIPVNQLNELKAESSVAFNLGADYDLMQNLRLRINLFSNNVEDMIENAPIARRFNGQPVYSYLNLERIYTRGLEAEVRWRPFSDLRVSAGYQLLDAKRQLENERTVQDEYGEIITKVTTSYEPMLNRSAHSGSFKLFYENERGWGGTLRGMYRGRYALFDLNGNGYADKNEYEKGYMLWNGSLSKRMRNGLRIQGGVDNLFDYTHIHTPYLPGRIWYAQLSIDF